MLELTELIKDYRNPDGQLTTVLALPQLKVADREQVALAGPSGSGKTTLLHLVAGLATPTGGAIYLDGVRVDMLSGAERDRWRARNIGYIFQNYNLLNSLDVLENILVAMAFARIIPPKRQRSRADELLEAVGLTTRRRHHPRQLSGGEQQRVAVARALVNQPRLILADEPTASLDRENSAKVLELLVGLAGSHASMVILATHDPTIRERFERVVELERPEVNRNAAAHSVA